VESWDTGVFDWFLWLFFSVCLVRMDELGRPQQGFGIRTGIDVVLLCCEKKEIEG
jgi:hypothetical protein